MGKKRPLWFRPGGEGDDAAVELGKGTKAGYGSTNAGCWAAGW